MKHLNVAAIALSVTAVAAAAIAQTAEAPGDAAASRRQSGKVGPPLGAASVNPPTSPTPRIGHATGPEPPSTLTPTSAPSPTTAPAPAEHATPTTETTAVQPASAPARTGPASRRASGRLTEAPTPSGLPVRPDRN